MSDLEGLIDGVGDIFDGSSNIDDSTDTDGPLKPILITLGVLLIILGVAALAGCGSKKRETKQWHEELEESKAASTTEHRSRSTRINQPQTSYFQHFNNYSLGLGSFAMGNDSELPPQIPQELVDRIIEELSKDKDSLRACALTCQSFKVPSQKGLFHHIKLKGSDSLNRPLLCERFHSILQTSSHIAGYVKDLVLVNHEDGTSWLTEGKLSTINSTPVNQSGADTCFRRVMGSQFVLR
ncbi:hypothetical protein K435DRAFT_861816 [Dendrothele bispora CBS 962.96]|uniref:F-box domain-containing protein n=1 Tax=Dendrothele bispora (strain CBS 962.96) TaxID=1314807 RepID=A0A4S8LUA8_DENBC|nr:hypothetical protein K435DRAFT_861816 [Dendrothele bispora CBS 962.96]